MRRLYFISGEAFIANCKLLTTFQRERVRERERGGERERGRGRERGRKSGCLTAYY